MSLEHDSGPMGVSAPGARPRVVLKVGLALKVARRAARRKTTRVAGPASRIQTALVTARPVSQPSEVVAIERPAA